METKTIENVEQELKKVNEYIEYLQTRLTIENGRREEKKAQKTNTLLNIAKKEQAKLLQIKKQFEEEQKTREKESKNKKRTLKLAGIGLAGIIAIGVGKTTLAKILKDLKINETINGINEARRSQSEQPVIEEDYKDNEELFKDGVKAEIAKIKGVSKDNVEINTQCMEDKGYSYYNISVDIINEDKSLSDSAIWQVREVAYDSSEPTEETLQDTFSTFFKGNLKEEEVEKFKYKLKEITYVNHYNYRDKDKREDLWEDALDTLKEGRNEKEIWKSSNGEYVATIGIDHVEEEER